MINNSKQIIFNTICNNFTSEQLLQKRRLKSDINVYYGDSETYYSKKASLIKLLSPNELARLMRFKNDSDQLNYLVSHSLLRSDLSNSINQTNINLLIEAPPFSKPQIKSANTDFNLSHSFKHFAYAISNSKSKKVGVDIEFITPIPNIECIIEKNFHVEEVSYILNEQSSQIQLQHFYEIWTRKEAFLKMLGIGISIDLSLLNMTPGTNLLNINSTLLLLPSIPTMHNINITTLITNQFIVSVSSNATTLPNFIEK